MKKIIKLTESDLERIVRRVIKEQSQPKIKQIVFDAKVFKPGLYTPMEITQENQVKLDELVAWLNNPEANNKKITITITAGSSKIPPRDKTRDAEEYNIELAKKRGETGINYLKSFLVNKVPTNVLNSINYVVDTSAAYKGPEYNGNPNDPKYLQYQFVKITAVLSSEDEILKEPKNQKPSKWRSQVIPESPHMAFIYFCVGGFKNGKYCSDWGNPVYLSNGFGKASNLTEAKQMRWVPIPEMSSGINWGNSDFITNSGKFTKESARCFQYEFSGQQNERCGKVLQGLDDYSSKYFNDQFPGPEIGNQYQDIRQNWAETR